MAFALPPRGPSPLVPIAAALGLAIGLLSAPAPSRAVVTGWCLEAKACRGAVFRPLPTSDRLRIKYVCETRARVIDDAGTAIDPKLVGLPAGRWTITARCVAVEGMPSA